MTSSAGQPHKTKRGLSWRVWFALVFLLMALASGIGLRASVLTAPMRLLVLATALYGAALALVATARLIRRHPRLLILALFTLIVVGGWACFGGKPVDQESLRREYVNTLRSFAGTRFVWGGESHLGIDCSGLARTALWQAMLKQGIRKRNPRLLGPTLWRFWWRDISASAMGSGTYGYTREIGGADHIAGCDFSRLKPGDLGVAGGGHVMIYLGDGRWIEASPDDAKVVTNPAPADTQRSWFRVRVRFVRWWIFE